MEKMRRLTVLALATLALFGCGGGSGLNQTAAVRTIHASPDAGSVDVYVQNFIQVTNLTLGNEFPIYSTNATVVNPGADTIRVYSNGSTKALVTNSITYVANHLYTEILAGPAAGLRLLTIDDPRTNFVSGQTYLRLVHASTLVSGMDIYVTTPDVDITKVSPTVTGIARYGATGLIQLGDPSIQYRIRTTPTGTKTVVLDALVTVSGGSYNMFVARDNTGFSNVVLDGYRSGF